MCRHPAKIRIYFLGRRRRLISTTLLAQLGEKYFDYFVFNIVDCGINCGLSRLGARRRALTQTIGNARGLDINSS
jgi:hypothetical protein